ncbi:MAG: short-chain dehydorgenase/reductase [Bradyrhizobium sp.]|nr:short-chain dehydorgenase/reductase [Bradyrhizobium sp.]
MVLAARREALLDEVAVEANSMGGEAIPIVADISDPADGASVARAAMVRFGGIDVWINFAGIGAIGRFWEIPLEDHVRLVEINLLGTCRLMRRATDIGLSSALSLILTLIIAAFDVILGGTAILRHLLRYVRFRDWCSS